MARKRRLSITVKEHLITFASFYERKDFLNGDPSWFMHQVKGKNNQETMAFIASCLSYGSRTVFLKKIQFLLDVSKGEPYDWIKNGGFIDEIPDNSVCFYRLYTNHTMYVFFMALREMLLTYGSIGEYVKAYAQIADDAENGKKTEAITAIEAICSFFAERNISGIVPKNVKSSCKRVCMFLRWMVRDGSPVDLGIWCDFIDKKSLIIPLDTHVVNQGIKLNLINSRTSSMSVARKLTDELLRVFPDDPLKGDFALFGYGVANKGRWET
ncbi:TIGR02757 family protein [Prevotella sp. HUN102]|uniref:TIGR02757 family protein n=1 Tax=Prevotella sp. HUN102 TaxID=1392486 RepID=UPI00048A6073|nr:TIGR02757 family protein [Prevotella sp. HUN102]